MPIADSYRVTERVLEGGDMWNTKEGLKTRGSQRQIPLVGASLWAAKRIKETNSHAVYAFPRYNTTSIRPSVSIRFLVILKLSYPIGASEKAAADNS